MMEELTKYIGYLFSAFVAAIVWVAPVNFLPYIGNSDPKMITAIVTVCGTLIIAVILALISQKNGKKREVEAQKSISERELQVQKPIRGRELEVKKQIREIDESHRERKVATYLEFVHMVSAFMQGSNPENNKKLLSRQKILDKVEKFQNRTLLWGDPRGLKLYLNYRMIVGNSSDQIFSSIDRLYQAIREDIGLSNEALTELDTVRLYLKYPDEFDQRIDTKNQTEVLPAAHLFEALYINTMKLGPRW